jgi:PmbA protein
MINDQFAENLIETALDSGAECAEVYISEKRESEITVANKKPESVNIKSDRGYGIRVLVDSKIGFYSSNRIEKIKAIENIRNLVKATKLHTPDPFNVLPEKFEKQSKQVDEVFDPRIDKVPLSEKINAATDIEEAGMAYDPRMAGFVWVLYGDVCESYRVLNSSGIDIKSSGTICYGFAYCYANDEKTTQTGRFARAYSHYDKFRPQDIGRKAAEYAIRMLGSTEFKSGSMKAFFPPEAGIPLLFSLFGMIEADSVQKGKSPFRDKLGKKVGSEHVNIIDDGTLSGGLATRPYDSEGIASTCTTIIENGVLKNYLYDSYTARKGNTKSTGNASRSGYHSKPSIHPTNFYMAPGKSDPNSILQSIDSGIMITELSGLHAGINFATADFSVPAKGIIIKNGELGAPVDNISISGNLFDLLQNISETGNDLKWEPVSGMIGAPSFVIEDLKVIGRG